MLVFEILRNDVPVPTDRELISLMKSADWNYEYSDSDFLKKRGARVMEQIENMMYQLYKVDPTSALKIWSDYCPYAKKLDESIVPDFILRFTAIDETNR